MANQQISSDFPDLDYIPFTKGELILNDLVDVSIKSMAELVGADCWGLYIRHADHTITPLYNAYPFETPRAVPHWLDAIRTEMLGSFEHTVLSKVAVGDTLAILMFGYDGWAAYATRIADDQWRFKFRHHTNYGKGIAPQIDTVFNIKGYTPTGRLDALSLDASFMSYIVGDVKHLSVGVRRYIEIHMRNGYVFTLTFEPNLAIGGCADHHEIRTILEWYDDGSALPCEPDMQLEVDSADGWRLKDWLDRHSRHLPIY